ncbi:MAG: hypothetical protein IJZ82_07045 [Lachnospiraceae bacterium]|nr:hypothetical protein [Lachnospiraceae bacterium]
MQQFVKKLDISFADLYVTGVIACIGAAEVAHLAGLFLGLGMGTVSLIWGGFFALLLLFCILVWWKLGRRDRKLVPCHKGLPIGFLLLIFVQMLYIFCMQQLVTPGDITLETVTTFLQEDGIHRVNPLTGGAYINPLSMRYKILCLPTLYGAVCKLTGLLPEIAVCHIVPLIVLGGCYFSYYKLSGILFGKHLGKRYTFLILVALVLWMLDGATYLEGYGLLQGGYMGTTIRGLILIPYTLQGGLSKQWWKCALCVLAELCVCMTLWGLGFCLLITTGLVILHWCEERKSLKEAAS